MEMFSSAVTPIRRSDASRAHTGGSGKKKKTNTKLARLTFKLNTTAWSESPLLGPGKKKEDNDEL